MAIHNREAFLDKLAANLGRSRKTVVERPKWRFQPQLDVYKDFSQDELVDILEKQCGIIHTTFKKVNQAGLSTALYETIIGYGGESVITAKDERNTAYGLETFYEGLQTKGIDVHIWDASIGKENQVIAERAIVGITFSDMTLAESGTVTLFNNKDHGRSISLLPQTYIAIIPKSTIVPRITQVAQHLHGISASGKRVGSCVSLVTGPSNSADIEMQLIVGVHGPVKATYIIVDDA